MGVRCLQYKIHWNMIVDSSFANNLKMLKVIRVKFTDGILFSVSSRRKFVGAICEHGDDSSGSVFKTLQTGAKSQAELHFSFQSKLLSELSTWGIGGLAEYFIEVHSEDEMCKALRHCSRNSIPVFILGKGSNCLFDDRGYNGCVILNSIQFLEGDLQSGFFRVGSGYPFNVLGIELSKKGFTGLEFAGGIPGTVGGAVFMNAGAQSQETLQVLQSVEVVTMLGDRKILSREDGDLTYSYRCSPFQQSKEKLVITAATFELKRSETSRQHQQEYMEKRRRSQPLFQKTAGCVFRNPSDGISAGLLIDQLGLKGETVGGAQISTLHANFLVNLGSSTCSDVLELIEKVKRKVEKETGILLQEEIVHVPFSQQSRC